MRSAFSFDRLRDGPFRRFRSLQVLLLAATLATAGLVALAPRVPAPRADAAPADRAEDSKPEQRLAAPTPGARHAMPLNGFYPAEVLRVIDGDTVEMRVAIWLGQQVETRIRMRGIDAPELRARCEDEMKRAEAAKARLTELLATDLLYVTDIGYDKYGNRVLARIVDRSGADLGERLVSERLARVYQGGHRAGWCG